MKREKLRLSLFVLIFITVLFMGCSTGNSDPDDEEPTPTPPTHTVIEKPTIADIAGIWVLTAQTNIQDYDDLDGDGDWQESAGTCTSAYTLSIAADGSFTLIQNRDNEMTLRSSYVDSYAEKGTIAITEGRWTKTITETFTDEDEMTNDASSIIWEPADSTFLEKDEITLVDGSLYRYVYRRIGSGDEIEGSWARVYQSSSYDKSEDCWDDMYQKFELEISGTTMDFTFSMGPDESCDLSSSSDTYQLTDNGDGTYTFLENGELKTFLVADNVLVFTSNEWEKQ